MPAVLSKPCHRFPHENILASQLQGAGVTFSLPLHMLHTVTPMSRLAGLPESDWETYAEQNGIVDAAYAGALLDLTLTLPTDLVQALEDKGYDSRVVTYWLREEECRGFRSTLRACAQKLSRCETLQCDRERDHAVRSAIRTFVRFLQSSRRGDRGGFLCWHCHEPTNPGLVCEGCRYARYCGKACQKADWIYHCTFCKKDKSRASVTGWKSDDQLLV